MSCHHALNVCGVLQIPAAALAPGVMVQRWGLCEEVSALLGRHSRRVQSFSMLAQGKAYVGTS